MAELSASIIRRSLDGSCKPPKHSQQAHYRLKPDLSSKSLNSVTWLAKRKNFEPCQMFNQFLARSLNFSLEKGRSKRLRSFGSISKTCRRWAMAWTCWSPTRISFHTPSTTHQRPSPPNWITQRPTDALSSKAPSQNALLQQFKNEVGSFFETAPPSVKQHLRSNPLPMQNIFQVLPQARFNLLGDFFEKILCPVS